MRLLIRCAHVCLSLISLVSVAGCVSGTEAFQQYELAFSAQDAQGMRVLDRLAEAERTVEQRGRSRSQAITEFHPDQARYYIDVGDPPLTAYVRDSVAVVKHYNVTLDGLATGASAQELAAEVGLAATSVAGAAEAVAAISGAGLVAPGFATASQATIAPLLPVFEQLMTIRNRTVFRQQFLDHYGDVRALLLEDPNDGTTEIFNMI